MTNLEHRAEDEQVLLQRCPGVAELSLAHSLFPQPEPLPQLVLPEDAQGFEGAEQLQLTLPCIQTWGDSGHLGRGVLASLCDALEGLESKN